MTAPTVMVVMVVLAVTVLPRGAWGDEPAKPAPAPGVVRTGSSPVRAGKTTVTVIDEGDSFDSIVERVRAARTQEPRVREGQAAHPAPGTLVPVPGERATRGPDPDKTGTPGGRPPRGAGPRDGKSLGDPNRPPREIRERIRARIREGKPLPPRLENRIERRRSR